MADINIEAGPIDRLSLKIDGPGVYLMRAENGAGKSIALSAVKTLMTGEGRLPIGYEKDKAEVSGLGVTVSFGRTGRGKTKFGELSVRSIEGSYSLGSFVRPGNKDPLVADSKRIKELLRISGYKVGPETFSGLFGGKDEFDEIVQSGSISTGDPVEMASMVKRDIEEAARHYEAVFLKSKAEAEAISSSIPKEIKCDGLESKEQIQAELAEAKESLMSLARQRAESERAASDHGRFEMQLQAMEWSDESEIIEQGKRLAAVVGDLKSDVSVAEKRLSELKERLAVESDRLEKKRAELSDAKRMNESIAKLRASLEERIPRMPDAGEFVDAETRIESAVRQLDAANQAESISELSAKMRELFFKAEESSLLSSRYRDSAARVEEVLAGMVSSCCESMAVKNGRLVIKTERGEELFSDLSEGQCCRIGIRMLIDSMKRRFPDEMPICVLEQEFWEPLQPSVKNEIREIAKQEGVAIIAAEASDDPEITVESPSR